MNKELLTKTIIFVAGTAIGSIVTWKLVKTKYEQIANEEIESVKDAYFMKKSDYDDSNNPGEKLVKKVDKSLSEENESIKQAVEISEKMGYTFSDSQQDEENEENEEGNDEMDKPHIISPEEFGEEDYAVISLIYYTDGIVTNEQNKIVANADELLGEDFAEHFGDYDYDPDTVYVRDDEREIDYEVLKDYRAYSEID